MSTSKTLAMVLVLVVGLSIAAPAAVAQEGDNTTTPETPTTAGEDSETEQNTTTEDNNSSTLAPGQKLSGMVAMQGEEVRGDIDKRAFGLQIANSNSDNARAGVVGEQAEENQQQLTELQEERADLREARDNGEITQGEFTTRMAKLSSQVANLQEMNNETENATQGLPVETLEANGVNVTAIQTLRTSASELSGPEVAAIAQSIAGGGPPDDAGESNGNGNGNAPGAGTPGNSGVDDNSTDENETADERDEIEQEISELEEERQDLQDAFDNGEISEEEYNQELSEIESELDALNAELDALESDDSDSSTTTDSGSDNGSQSGTSGAGE